MKVKLIKCGHIIVNITNKNKSITLRSYLPDEYLKARQFATLLSDCLKCEWQEQSSTVEITGR